jgi:beta-lactamase class D
MNKLIFILLVLVITANSCQRNNIHEKIEWGTVFQSYGLDTSKCAFEVYEKSKERVFYFNKRRGNYRMSPASTFKILNSLIALETSVAPDEELVIKWDGIARAKSEWNTDMNMREAFKVSNVPYYQELARRIGKAEMQKWIDTVRYGNKQIGDKIDEFWLNETLKITPDEQIGFMKKLYFDELPFSKRSMRIVRSMMLQENNGREKLYYKTGTGSDSGRSIFWQVGFLEDSTNHPYFFANAFQGDTGKDFQNKRLEITKKLFNQMSLCLPIKK